MAGRTCQRTPVLKRVRRPASLWVGARQFKGWLPVSFQDGHPPLLGLAALRERCPFVSSWHVATPRGCGHRGASTTSTDTYDHDVCDAIAKITRHSFTEMRAACCGLYTVPIVTEITHKVDCERDRSGEGAAPLRSWLMLTSAQRTRRRATEIASGNKDRVPPSNEGNKIARVEVGKPHLRSL